jgi:DNA-binding HxlR family transcriptional regulator
MKRSYRQHCAVAKALDVIGERWTLLLVRELLLGPRRYKDLLAGLPGIGTNLLAERLRELEHSGVIERRTLPPPAGATVYELTALGHGLQAAVLELGRWGARFLAEPSGGDALRAGWYVVSMLATVRPELADGVDMTIDLRVQDEVFRVRVRDGEATIAEPGSGDRTLALTCDLPSFLALLAGELSPSRALEDSLIEVDGDRDDLFRFYELFRWPAPAAR